MSRDWREPLLQRVEPIQDAYRAADARAQGRRDQNAAARQARRPTVADAMGWMDHARAFQTPITQGIMAAGGASADVLNGVGRTMSHAGKGLGLLGEVFEIADDRRAGKSWGAIAARSRARTGALWGASELGAAAGGVTGGAIGAALGAPAAGVGALPGGGLGAVIGGGLGGASAGLAADWAGVDDRAAQAAEDLYLRKVRQRGR